MRKDGREYDQLRKVTITPDFVGTADGSVLIEQGNTRIICTAKLQDGVPKFLEGGGGGWLTAEYSMLPGSTQERSIRDTSKGKTNGRSQEIQRLIGRAMRSVFEPKVLGERTVWLDCDVIEADGGTRTASINGAYLALFLSCAKLIKNGRIKKIPLRDFVAAISVGIYKGKVCLDLNYEEDSHCEVDMNVVMTGKGKFVEIQGTAERNPFSMEKMTEMVELARTGIDRIVERQCSELSSICPDLLKNIVEGRTGVSMM